MVMPLWSINRNILECKGDVVQQAISCIVVLIETYWNVKGEPQEEGAPPIIVLIETYWNVK